MKSFVTAFAAIALSLPLVMPSTAQGPALTLTVLGSLKSGPLRGEDPRVAEINAFDAAAARIYVVNPRDGRLDVIDASNPAAPAAGAPVDIDAVCADALGAACPVRQGSEPNSVAIHGSTMAVAVANVVRTDNGHAVFFELNGDAPPTFIAAVEAGALPDMITFTGDGKHVLVANEGEPNQSYEIDPPGTVTFIAVDRIGSGGAARQVGFERFDNPGQRAKLEAEGVRIFGPGASAAQDLEPEYIATDGNKAYVTLQENNALAIINIAGATVEKIVGLGLKDHSADGEGDAREYAAFTEARRVGNQLYPLDPAAFPDALDLKLSSQLGRLNASIASGDANGDGLYERIEVFGGRSVSVRDHQGALVWDSGEKFERLSQEHHGTRTIFNTTNTANSLDNRSDDKGVEPESVVIGDVGGRLYAFVGLERDGGIVVYDASAPASPVFVTYVTNRKLPRNSSGGLVACGETATSDCGDLGPEGLTFVPAVQSPTGKALLIVSNEVSSTTTIWQVQ
jgi:DNA-binding beta-propeller fold protein YncE